MKKLILIIVIITFQACHYKKKPTTKAIKMQPNDTIIRFSKNRQMYYTGYKEVVDSVYVYTERYLFNNKWDTIASYGNYSGCWYELSPNKQFVLIDDYMIGYLDVSDTETKLIDRWRCALIRLSDGEGIHNYQSYCGGEWNSKNQWILGDEIIFDPKVDIK